MLDQHTIVNKDGEVTRWSDEKRLEAVLTYLALGKMSKVRDATGIPLKTLWDWKSASPWWPDLERKLRQERNEETAGTLSTIVDKALHAIKERVEGGDYVYNPRSGDIVRVPVSAASLNKIASTLLDRRLVMDKEAQDRPELEDSSTDKLEKQLDKLANSFKAFVAHKQKREKVIEGTYAVHDEREAGLQEGTPVGAQAETQPGQG